MLEKLVIKNFKRLIEAEIALDSNVVLAGPNNFGKTSSLQALSIWSLATQRWIEAREETGSQAKERTGVRISRRDFTAVPVRSLDLLWTGRAVGRRSGEARAPLVQIWVEGSVRGDPWKWGMELQYQSPELLHCRAIESGSVPQPVKELTVVHVPPLGGIQTDEEKREPGIQNRLIGEGRPGEIIRNLLLQVFERDASGWERLRKEIQTLFQISLLEPKFSGTYITCDYLPSSGKAKALDIANAGSGFHQVLLLLAFFYARPGSVLLLDEPDAHLHVILQRDIYGLIRRVAQERKAQVIISTHSEVILDETDPSSIVAFTGKKPHRLVNSSQKAQLKKALKDLRSLDFLLADQVGSVLYVEGETDVSILREWARVLSHPALDFLDRPYVYPLGGDDLAIARDHYFSLRDAYPELKALGVVDRRGAGLPAGWSGPEIRFWPRREIENYLLHPQALRRFVEGAAALGAFVSPKVDAAFAKQLPVGADPFDSGIVFLRDVKASEEFLIPLMAECGMSTSKKDLFLIAAQMQPGEIHPDVVAVLDAIAGLVRRRGDPEAAAMEASGSSESVGDQGSQSE